MTEWTNDRRHLINPVLLRMLGDLTGQRALDAGCGNGYLSRMLAERGAEVVGVEPGHSLFDFAVEKEHDQPCGIRYVPDDFHRTISTYLNQLIRLGCQLVEIAEPGLAPETAADGPGGIDAYVHLPNFLIAAARSASGRLEAGAAPGAAAHGTPR